MFCPPPDPPEPQYDEQALIKYAAEQLDAGAMRADVRRELVARGMDVDRANHVINALSPVPTDAPGEVHMSRAEQREYRQALHDAGKKNMTYGALWCAGGLAVTVFSFAAAQGGGGGRYVVAWGAVIFGAIQFFRGLSQVSGE